ncbi:MAG: YceI family protein [Saprospiraceae bacterium]|nr:YceI family protein [Saprospiraceae bacterium]
MFHLIFNVLFFISLTFRSFYYDGEDPKHEIWLVKSNSSLKVDGKTNINSFNCVVPSYGKMDTLICYRPSSINEPCRVESKLIIEIENFDCHHKIMTKDLQKTLKAHTYPSMIIDIKSFSRILSSVTHSSSITGKADITLAGVVKNYTINFSYRQIGSDNVELIGTRAILFSDFGLKPPSKLGGTIKVKDQLDVEFKLQLKKVKH